MISDKIFLLLSDILGTHEDDITAATLFTKEYGITPLDVAKLMIAVEKEFDITIHDEDAAQFTRVGDVITYVGSIFHEF